MSSHPLCRRHHNKYVRHNKWHMYAIMCTVHDIIYTLYDNNHSYLWHHMHYIWHSIYCVRYHIYNMCDIRKCLYLRPHTLYVNDICTLYGITHSVMTTQPLCNFTATMSDITPTVSLSSHIMYQFYQTQCMYDITATICMTSYALPMTSHHFMYDIRSTLSDLTSCVSLSSHPPYRWYYSHYMYDITSNIYVISHSLYLWHNTH